MGLHEMWNTEKLKNEAKHLILLEKKLYLPSNLWVFLVIFFFSGTDNDQKVNLSTIIIMEQHIHVCLGENIRTEVAQAF